MTKGILQTLGIVVLVPVLAIGALIGFAAYANHAAEQAAKNFCAGIQIGSDIHLAVLRAEQENIRYSILNDNAGYDFTFQAWVFNAGVCHAIVTNGKVVSLHSELEGD